MRKLASAVCALVAACMMLAGCADNTALRDELVGTWDFDSDTLARFVGDNLTDDQLNASRQLMFLNLAEDGSAEFVLFGDVQNGSWTVEGSDVAITIGSESASATFEDGVLTMGNGEMPISFVKAEEPRAVPTEEESTQAMTELVGIAGGGATSDDAAVPDPDARIELTDLDAPIVVGDNEVATITVTAFGTNVLGDPGYNLHIENHSGVAVRLNESGFTVNGIAVTAYGDAVIGAGAADDAFLAFDAEDYEGGMTVESLTDVYGVLSVEDDETANVLAFYDFAM